MNKRKSSTNPTPLIINDIWNAQREWEIRTPNARKNNKIERRSRIHKADKQTILFDKQKELEVVLVQQWIIAEMLRRLDNQVPE